MRTLTQKDFIDRAKLKFPEYDYSKVEYVNNKTKVKITCPEHGEFQIRPNDLLLGTGCPVCGGTKKQNKIEYIKKANLVHNGYFSYDKCEYTTANNKVIITCPLHGDFEVKANNHLAGQGCPVCRDEGIKHEITKLPPVHTSTRKLTTEEFIKKCEKKWGNKYQYDKVDYKKSGEKVIITCPEHGDFLITPNHFLNGRGCSKCAKNYRMTTEEFIDKLKLIDGDRYLYDKIQYVSTHKPVIVTCKKHGDFYCSPANLLKGKGCPICHESILEKIVGEFLIQMGFNFERQKRFSWLGRQSLDFYLPDYNIAIECQGEQHFEDRHFFGRTLTEQINDDERKKTKCLENNIDILYVAKAKRFVDNITILDLDNLKTILKNLAKP